MAKKMPGSIYRCEGLVYADGHRSLHLFPGDRQMGTPTQGASGQYLELFLNYLVTLLVTADMGIVRPVRQRHTVRRVEPMAKAMAASDQAVSCRSFRTSVASTLSVSVPSGLGDRVRHPSLVFQNGTAKLEQTVFQIGKSCRRKEQIST